MGNQKVFVNFTNHPSVNWNEEQRKAAMEYGEIVDIPFPAVSAGLDEEGVRILAKEAVSQILDRKPVAVLCQGEFCLAYMVIDVLLQEGIEVVAACSERVVVETMQGDKVVKESQFHFVRFRRYEKK